MPIPMPALPGFQTAAAWPVWSGSTTQPVDYQPVPKKAAVKLWHRARDFDRRTHKPGRHGGAIGSSALQVLHALIFDFWNFRYWPARPRLCRHRPQVRCLPAHGGERPGPVARAGHPDVAAPLPGCHRGGWPVPAGAADQRLSCAARGALARLHGASRGASARTGHMGRAAAYAVRADRCGSGNRPPDPGAAAAGGGRSVRSGGGAGEPRRRDDGARTRDFSRTATGAEKPPYPLLLLAPDALAQPTAPRMPVKAAQEMERRRWSAAKRHLRRAG